MRRVWRWRRPSRASLTRTICQAPARPSIELRRSKGVAAAVVGGAVASAGSAKAARSG